MNTSARLLAAAALAGFVVALGGCSSSKKSPMVVASSAPEGMDNAMVMRGETLTVRLPTRNGSEYGWRLSPESARDGFLSLEARKDAQSQGSEAPGAPAWDVFTFNAKRAGQTTLTFVFDRPWDSGPAVREYSLHVDVLRKGQTAETPMQASVTVE